MKGASASVGALFVVPGRGGLPGAQPANCGTNLVMSGLRNLAKPPEELAMIIRASSVTLIIALLLAVLCVIALAAQDKYTVQVPGGLAFSEFRGYEDWQTVAVSKTDAAINAILANSVAIDAYVFRAMGSLSPTARSS